MIPLTHFPPDIPTFHNISLVECVKSGAIFFQIENSDILSQCCTFSRKTECRRQANFTQIVWAGVKVTFLPLFKHAICTFRRGF